MRITFKLFAMLQDYLPSEARRTNALELELTPGTTVAQVIERFGLPQKSCKMVLIDGRYVPPDERASQALQDGNVLAIWPPIAGG